MKRQAPHTPENKVLLERPRCLQCQPRINLIKELDSDVRQKILTLLEIDSFVDFTYKLKSCLSRKKLVKWNHPEDRKKLVYQRIIMMTQLVDYPYRFDLNVERFWYHRQMLIQ